jgi:DNA-binding NarL/FixJ family response regulator
VIGVVVADDQGLVRAGFRALLSAEPDIEVLAEAADGRDAIDVIEATRPDVALMDIRMPRLDGLQATARISQDTRLTGTRILVLTTFELDEYVFGALRAGASGFLLKDVEPALLIDAVRTVAAGEALLTPNHLRRLIEAYVTQERAGPSRTQAAAASLEPLTPRECEVLALVGRGLSNAEIAQALVLSPATAKTHVARVFSKLGARDRAQLVITAYESGLITPGRHDPH